MTHRAKVAGLEDKLKQLWTRNVNLDVEIIELPQQLLCEGEFKCTTGNF